MSGEHGDGLARSLWNRKLFGPEIYAAFQAVKHAFDPKDLLNPGKVLGDADPGENLRIGPDYHPHEPRPTALDFSKPRGLRPGGCPGLRQHAHHHLAIDEVLGAAEAHKAYLGRGS